MICGRIVPSNRPARAAVVAASALAAACAPEGIDPVTFPAEARSAVASEVEADGVTVRLHEARVAFGPAVFCAAASGSATLCETAVCELRQTTEIDLLRSGATPLGAVRGFEGEIRSASFDYGVHWFLTETDARAAADAPDGHSLVITGEMRRGEQSASFRARVTAAPPYRGQRVVSTLPVAASIDQTTNKLEVGFDVATWLEPVNWAGLLESAATSPNVPIEITAGTEAHDALLIAMTTRPPSFDWR